MAKKIEDIMRKISLPKRYFSNAFIISEKFKEENDIYLLLLGQYSGEEFGIIEKEKIQQKISEILKAVKLNSCLILDIFKSGNTKI